MYKSLNKIEVFFLSHKKGQGEYGDSTISDSFCLVALPSLTCSFLLDIQNGCSSSSHKAYIPAKKRKREDTLSLRSRSCTTTSAHILLARSDHMTMHSHKGSWEI